MSSKYNSLEELRRKKNVLKGEITQLEDILTFKNTKESLSAFTNGLSDEYLQEKIDEDGNEKTVIRKGFIANQIKNQIQNAFINKNSAIGIANSALKTNATDTLVKLGIVTIIGNYAKKNMKSSNWKNKILGLAIIYIAPVALKYVRKNLEIFQKNKSVSSIEKLI